MTRLAIGFATATVGHAFLLLGLGWMAPLPRSADVPNGTVQVDVAVPDPALVGAPPSAIAQGDGSTAGGPRVASIRRPARARRAARLDNPLGPTMRVAPAIVSAAVVTEAPAPAILSTALPPPVPTSVAGGASESPAKVTSLEGTGAPGSVPSRGGGPGAASSAAGVRYRSHPPPPYPIDSLRRREEGVVLLSVDIGPDGRATQVSLSRGSGSPSLDSAAIEAVYSWTFEPARNAGAPVASRAVIPVRFSLVGR